MAEHVADRNGKCKKCVVGAKAGSKTWPCAIWNAAKAATEVPVREPGQRVERDR